MGPTCPTNTQAQAGFGQVQGLDPRAKALGLRSPSGVLVKDVAVGEPEQLQAFGG